MSELVKNNVNNIKELTNKLVDELKHVNDNKGKDKIVSIHLFGIKYGSLIKENNIKVSNLIKEASLDDSLKVELSKGIKLSQYVKINSEKETNEFNFNVFGLHMKFNNDCLRENDSYISIGWSLLGDLSLYSDKEQLLKKFKTIYKDNNEQFARICVGQLWKFSHIAKKGDYVIYSDNLNVYIGKITSDYYFDDNLNYNSADSHPNCRKIEWLKRDINRMALSINFRSSLATSLSFFTLNDYKSAVLDLINNKYTNDATEEENDYIFDFKLSNIKDGCNIIVYGTPGCGKSYYVDHHYLGKNDEDTYSGEFQKDNIIRTTFYPDYSNSDFVGQIMPKVTNKGLEYIFNPGPFTIALVKAIENPSEKVALVIEEINRGNAASIFGDIFQLLDRKNGSSEYGIINTNIMNFLNGYKFKVNNSETSYLFKEIKIPGNMFIYATMNTSDQNIYTLDTAFTRRWKKERLNNDFTGKKIGSLYVPGMEDVTWKELVEAINDYILANEDILQSSEDKQLGVYFISEDDLDSDNDDEDNSKVNYFANKILEYLWDDVSKLQRDIIFDVNIKTLEQAINRYKINPKSVFNSNLSSKIFKTDD